MSKLIPGTQVVVYASKETTYGTPRRVTGTSAFRTLSERFTPAEERLQRDDRTGSPDYLENVVGRKSAEWEITKLLLPNGNVTTLPDDHLLWEAGLGRMSLNNTFITFRQATAHTTSLTIRRGVRGAGADAADFQEHVEGAIVNRVEIAWGSQGNNGQAQVTFAGPAQRWGYTGNSSLNCSGGNMTSTVLNITVTNAKQFTPGSVISIAKSGVILDTAGNSGILITAVNVTTNRLTFTTSLSATHSKHAVIKPYNPTTTTAGVPIHAKLGYLSLDGSTSVIKHLGGRITYEDNRRLLNDEVGQSEATEVIREQRRNVTFSLEYLLKSDEVPPLLGAMYHNEADDLFLVLGDATGSQTEFRMRNAKYEMSPIEIGQEMARVTMTGRAYGNAGNDSLVMRIK